MSKVQQALVGSKEASEIIGESVKNTIRRVESGQLKPVTKLPGLRGAYLFDRADIEAIATKTTPSSEFPHSDDGVSFGGDAA